MDCSCAQGRVDSATRMEKKKKSCLARHNRHMHLFISAMKRWDESVNIREEPQHYHDVSPTMEVWSNADAALLGNAAVCDDLIVEEFVCTSVLRWPVLGINNGHNCLLGKQTNGSLISLICLQHPRRVLSDCGGNKSCRMHGSVRREAGEPEELKVVEKERGKRLQCRPARLAVHSCSARPPRLAK